MEQFHEKYPDVDFSRKLFVQHKDRIKNKNCICKGKSTGGPSVLTELPTNYTY